MSRRCGMQAVIAARNPEYQKILLDFKVKFRSGYEFGLYRELVRQELIRFLSPWAFDADRSLSFGGKVYKSVLLDFVEDLDYVDYVTDFKMYSYRGDQKSNVDISEAGPETPDAILVSDRDHVVELAS